MATLLAAGWPPWPGQSPDGGLRAPPLSAPLQINPIALPPQRVELMERVIKMMPHWKLLTPQQK
jgi:hypothetical protein